MKTSLLPKTPGKGLLVPVLAGSLLLGACQTTWGPSVAVRDQDARDGTITVDSVFSTGPGWIVIHAQADGRPGPVLGHAAVRDGINSGVRVSINQGGATTTLYAMLHTDAGQVGVYEFPGPDGPVQVEGTVITRSFNSRKESGSSGGSSGY